MVAVDSSTLVAFFRGEEGRDVDALDGALERGQLVLPPVVLVEILSAPRLDRRVARLLEALPVLEPDAGYWGRAAATRAALLAKRLRARLADTLICQSCLDYRVPLITRDTDFEHFRRHTELVLA